MLTKNDKVIKKHYKEQAKKYGASGQSTMDDIVVRDKEIELIRNFFAAHRAKVKTRRPRVLDLGCGNGYTLSILSKNYPLNIFWGLDFSEDLLCIAKERRLKNCKFIQADTRSLPFCADYFDVVYSERCLINILNWQEQKVALNEIHRVIKPGGYYLIIECFTDGLMNNNKARKVCGMDALKEAYHNKYFDKKLFFKSIKDIFKVIEPAQLDPKGRYPLPSNFLSSHYFISRVIYPLVTHGKWVRNSEFVKFFYFLPPIGNYSQIQAYILLKK